MTSSTHDSKSEEAMASYALV